MNITKLNCVAICLLAAMSTELSFAAQSKGEIAQKDLRKVGNSKQTTNKSDQKKYYLYDEATDAYITEIIDQSNKLWENGDPDGAIALLLKEQARLDKKGRKVNLPVKFVKAPDGRIIRLRDGQKSDFPEAGEDEVPRFPSPLVLTLMTIRMDDGQCPLEMIDYYKGFAKNSKGTDNHIIAASQVVSLLGLNNEKSWEFVNATFNQNEKTLLIKYFIEEFINKQLKTKTTEITHLQLNKLVSNQYRKGKNTHCRITPVSYLNIRKAVIESGGLAGCIPFINKQITTIDVEETEKKLKKWFEKQTSKMEEALEMQEVLGVEHVLGVQEAMDMICSITGPAVRGWRMAPIADRLRESNEMPVILEIYEIPVTFKTYLEIKNTLVPLEIPMSNIVFTKPPMLDVNIERLEIDPGAYSDAETDINYVLKYMIPEQMHEGMQEYYTKLEKRKKDCIEGVFWDSCPQCDEFNVSNRLARAMQCRDEKKYVQALGFCDAILERYKGQEIIKSNVAAIQFECQIEDIFLGSKDYLQFSKIFEGYKDLLNGNSENVQQANILKALCLVFSEDSKKAAEFIHEKSFANNDFMACRLMHLISSDQRKVIDEFAWTHFKDWKEYNYKTQYRYALKAYNHGQYTESVRYFDRLNERYTEGLTSEVVLANVKCLIRLENIDKAILFLKNYKDLKHAENGIVPDILWLVHTGKSDVTLDFLSQFETLLGEKRFLIQSMMFYQAYSLLLEGKFEEGELVVNHMKKEYPRGLSTRKISYLNNQKERLREAFVFTQEDQFRTLVGKAGKCFDEGELEMAMGIYLRIFAEYPDRTEESSKACYLLGYYYLMSGDFEMANNILAFLKKEYKTSAYAKEADVLIQRIKDFTTL